MISCDYPKTHVAEGSQTKSLSSISHHTSVDSEHVKNLMRSNFPEKALDWVDDAQWVGPVTVPLDHVNFSNHEEWAASHQQGHVEDFVRRMKSGEQLPPAILVQQPGNDQYEIVDGHHRALADRELKKPVVAYVGQVPKGDNRWQETHSSQIHQGASSANKGADTDGIVAAGIAVRAKDTGRVLMLQRSLDYDDPAAGMWEFPGGRLEHGESPVIAAQREWQEETGCVLPPGEVTGQWTNGVYRGHVYDIAHESDVPIFEDRDAVINPDDPDGDDTEALAWWDVDHLDDNPSVRSELANDLNLVHAALGSQSKKFDPLQPRDSHGRWGHGGGTAVIDRPTRSMSRHDAQGIVDETRTHGGSSTNPFTGHHPTGGYMVAQKDGGHIMDAKDFYGSKGAHLLQDYVDAHSSDFASPDSHLGTWHDSDSGKVFLDISHNVLDHDQATKLGRDNDQIAIWDVKNSQEISTGGTGGLDKAETAATCETCGHERTNVSATTQFARHLAAQGKSFADHYGVSVDSVQKVGPKGYIHGWIYVGGEPESGAGVKLKETGTQAGYTYHDVHTNDGAAKKLGTIASGHGVHYAQYTDANGKSTQKQFKTQKGAISHLLSNSGLGSPSKKKPASSYRKLSMSLEPQQYGDLEGKMPGFLGSLSPGEKKSLYSWSNSIEMVRKFQRGHVTAKQKSDFNSALQRAPKVSGLTYRGVKPDTSGGELAKSLKPGDSLSLGEPVSTSIDPKQAAQFGTYVYEIESSSCAYIAGINTKYTGEKEAVLPPGKFVVTSVERAHVPSSPSNPSSVNVIHLKDVTQGARSWVPTSETGDLQVVSKSADDDDRIQRFIIGDDDLGSFKPDASDVSKSEGHGDAETLREYWTHGEGAAKIRWGEPGDFDRCVMHLSKYIDDPKGYCNERHHDALGFYPATHARMDEGK